MAGCIDLSKKRLKKFKELLLEAPEWDENKRLLVMQKHDVDFRVVARVFEFNDFVDIQPIANSMEEYGEIREAFMGEVDGTVYYGIFTRRNNDFRLITARRASTRERAEYYELKDEDMNREKETIEEKRNDAVVDEIDYFPEYDISKVISVHTQDFKKFFKEIDKKGWKKVRRRLTKEGYQRESGGHVYSPPGSGTKK